MVSNLENDHRWRRLHDSPWTCPSCKAEHQGLFDLAYDKPDVWSGDAKDKEPNSSVLTSTHFLAEDFCVVSGQHYIVRCVLELTIEGANEHFGYGVWASLLKRDFEFAVKHFDLGSFEGLGPWRGRLVNTLHGYPETINLKCSVRPQSGRRRPLIELEQSDHPLAREQQHGVTLDRLLDIYAWHGHNIRPALTD